MFSFFNNSMLMNIFLVIIFFAVIIFTIISSIINKKNQKLEKEKNMKQVKNKIKKYFRVNLNMKNLRVEYDKFLAKKGKEYKYRDVFNVIVDIYEGKNNNLLFKKAFEIEGISKKIDRKNYDIDWIVNKELELDIVKKEIEIFEKKIKLTKEEKKDKKKKKKEKNIKKIDKNILENNNNIIKNKIKNKINKFSPRK